MPSILFSNCISLRPKIDEITFIVKEKDIGIALSVRLGYRTLYGMIRFIQKITGFFVVIGKFEIIGVYVYIVKESIELKLCLTFNTMIMKLCGINHDLSAYLASLIL